MEQINTINNKSPENNSLIEGNSDNRSLDALLKAFRCSYPDGKIAVDVEAIENQLFVHARIYLQRQDPIEQYLGEAVVGLNIQSDSDGDIKEAQHEAITDALFLAGFRDPQSMEAVGISAPASKQEQVNPTLVAEDPDAKMLQLEEPEEEKDMTLEDAMKLPCPIKKYLGKTLGDLILLDPGALSWIVQKYTSDAQISEGAKLICESALQQVSA